MTLTSLSSLKNLEHYLASCSKDELKALLPEFSPPQLVQAFSILLYQPDESSADKLNAVFNRINEPSALEKLGSFLDETSLIHFLDYFIEHPDNQQHISFLFIGLPSEVFFNCLLYLKEEHIALIQHQSIYEPLKYHLTLLIDAKEALFTQLNKEVEHLYVQIAQNFESPAEFSFEKWENKISSFAERVHEQLHILSKILKIAWHTERPDLIDRLSHLNDNLHHLISNGIGQPGSPNRYPSGLYQQLQDVFSAFFDKAHLQNHDSALEGLTCLSIWHLKDYWQLGLLPGIENPEQLDHDPKHTEEEIITHKKELFKIVEKSLGNLKLKTVADLKNAHIFSKELLQKFILKNSQID